MIKSFRSTKELRQIADLEIACYMEPVAEVGSDYYDVLQHKGQIRIGIGDVTGHELESGVVMVMTQAIVHRARPADKLCTLLSQHWAEPAEVIKERVVTDVRQHIGAQRIYDDITLVVVKRRSVQGLAESSALVRKGARMQAA